MMVYSRLCLILRKSKKKDCPVYRGFYGYKNREKLCLLKQVKPAILYRIVIFCLSLYYKGFMPIYFFYGKRKKKFKFLVMTGKL